MYYDFLVKIPEEKGKIFERTIKGVTYINYEYDRVYKPDKKYNIPKRTTIGKKCFLQVLFGKNSSSFWRKFVLQNGECSRQYPRPSDPARALQTFIDFCVTFE